MQNCNCTDSVVTDMPTKIVVLGSRAAYNCRRSDPLCDCGLGKSHGGQTLQHSACTSSSPLFKTDLEAEVNLVAMTGLEQVIGDVKYQKSWYHP